MIDITHKQISLRRATAEGRVQVDELLAEKIRNDELPKGNLFDVARAAGLLASKKTADLIPHCHPVSIEGMQLEFELERDAVHIRCEAASIGRTGIEMEALTAVSVAALTIYDLLKPLKGRLEITGIRLLKKTGGKSDRRHRFTGKGRTAAILVCSDSTAAGKREDKSGKIIREMLEEYETDIVHYEIVSDEPAAIQAIIRKWADEGIQFIFTTGGTGLGPRDRSVEAVSEIIERDAPGISQIIRTFGQERTPLAMLSRGIAGMFKSSIVITLPGSSNGAREGMQAILPGVFHAADMVKGHGHD